MPFILFDVFGIVEKLLMRQILSYQQVIHNIEGLKWTSFHDFVATAYRSKKVL